MVFWNFFQALAGIILGTFFAILILGLVVLAAVYIDDWWRDRQLKGWWKK